MTQTLQTMTVADELRLIHKELGWIIKHIGNIYKAVKSEDDTAVLGDEPDPNQLELFTTENNENDNLSM